jgi:hypothetical protein
MSSHRLKLCRVAAVLLGALLLAAPRSGQAILMSPGIRIDAPPQHHAYILSQLQFKAPWTVQELPLTPGGHMRVLGGPLPAFCTHGPSGFTLLSLAISPRGSLYVSGFFGPHCEAGVEAFAPDAGGNVRPILRIEGNRTGLGLPVSIAFDRFGRLYVGQGGIGIHRSRPGQIDVFAVGAHGNVAPIAVIMGAKTQIQEGQETLVAVDQNGAIFAAQPDGNTTEVLKFAPGSNGNVAPLRAIQLGTTRDIEEFQAAGDTLYAAMGFTASEAVVYKLRTSDLSVTDAITNPAFTFVRATADREGRVYVQTFSPSTLYVYPPSSNTPKEAISDDIGGSGYVVVGP